MDAFESEWAKVLQHLVESMPQRIQAVLEAKGDPTYEYIRVPNEVATESILYSMCVCTHTCMCVSVYV